MSVLSSISDHLFGQWPHSPIGQLVLFVSQHATILLQRGSKTCKFGPQNPYSLTRVKHIDNVYWEVLLEPLNIVVCPMEDLRDCGIIKNAPHFGPNQLSKGNSINYEIFRSRWKLHKTHETLEGANMVMFEIYRDFSLSFELLNHEIKLFCTVHEE